MKLDREALRRAMSSGPAAIIATINRLGYRRGQFENGLEVIATHDAQDWVMQPSLSMRQADEWYRQWLVIPAVDMGK